MDKKHKLYLRLNLISLFFIVCSFIFTTFAWFAYSGLSKVETEINVKAWYIELEKEGEEQSNNIVVSLKDLSPGMETTNELVNIKNLGDSNAQISYDIVSARILDKEYIVDNDTITSESLEDILSHDYPFHVNINLSKNYVLAKGDESLFNVSISWPLDSVVIDDGDIISGDSLDTQWGVDAYQFQKAEQDKHKLDSSYVIRPSIEIAISVNAEQYIASDESSDYDYNLGDTVLFDVKKNMLCTEIGSSDDSECIKMTIIDKNNKIKDNEVTLLPTLYNDYKSGKFVSYNTLFTEITDNWIVKTRPLLVSDLLNIVSTDIVNSYLVADNISNVVIGNLNYPDRMETEINKAVILNGYYTFLNEKFDYFVSNECIWTNSEYNNDFGFALKKKDEINSNIYPENKDSDDSICKVVPVVIIEDKELLKNE